MTQGNEVLQVKMSRIKGKLCDSVGHTTASMTRFVFCLFGLVFDFSSKSDFDREVGK